MLKSCWDEEFMRKSKIEVTVIQFELLVSVTLLLATQPHRVVEMKKK